MVTEFPPNDLRFRGGGDIKRTAFVLAEQRIEDINHQVVLVVDDVWNSHALPSFEMY
jgi:hypothetical protein